MEIITLNFKHIEPFTEDEFYHFCLDNPELTFERSAFGQIIIMANTGGKTGRLNAKIAIRLGIWNETHQLGETFDSSTTFHLPSGADRSPDAAWVEMSRWAALTEKQQTRFPPLCPDFVIELRSESDSLKELQNKMQNEWLANGCRLAWLIDPKEEKTYIYHPENEAVTIEGFDKKLSGENILPGFELDLNELK
jgi:Uma2 family endonuclease